MARFFLRSGRSPGRVHGVVGPQGAGATLLDPTPMDAPSLLELAAAAVGGHHDLLCAVPADHHLHEVLWRRWATARPDVVGPVPERILVQIRAVLSGAEDEVVLVERESENRRRAHVLCDGLHLLHVSTGKHPQRRLSVRQPEGWAWPPRTEWVKHQLEVQLDQSAWRRKQDQDIEWRRVGKTKLTRMLRERLDELEFRVYHKYRSEGYDTPEEMLEHESGYREEIEALESELDL